ncbi:hypothetical protein S40293_04467 [Stachybotrys chartarum IBT 40293]|nr:hypothetical protein S40293_04467 [Stachybotrys chartarum IBT 40293]
MSGSSPASGRPGLEELRQCIGSLNKEYGLGIRAPDPTLSPSKHRQRRQSLSEGLYTRIHYLHFCHHDALVESLLRFRGEATQLSQRHVVSPAVYGDCLLKCLPDPGALLQKRIAPDATNHLQHKLPKRTKKDAYDNGLRFPTSHVDAIPGRASIRTASQNSIGTPSLSSHIDDIPVRSFNTSIRGQDSAIVILSDSEEEDVLTSVNTSFASSIQPSSRPSFPSFPSSNDTMATPNTSFGSMPDQPVPTPVSLEDRLRHVWPKHPKPGLVEPPLAVMWEVTRAAVHAGVDLSQVKLPYKPDESWHNQDKMMQSIYSLDAFRGKKKPAPSDPVSWNAALKNNFQRGQDAVTLSVSLVYRPNDSGPLFDVLVKPLRKPELGHRLGRRFGADRFLEISLQLLEDSPYKEGILKDRKFRETLIRWLSAKPHHFVGRLWVPFFVRKVDKPDRLLRIHLFAVNGNQFRMSRSPGVPAQQEVSNLEVRTNCNLPELLQWALNMSENLDQQPFKLFSRLALSLSRSWPTVTLQPHQLRHCKDDVGTHEVMNDGLGRMSRSLATKVAQALNLLETPCAFQARIGSAKGVWVIDLNDDGSDDDWLETYPSQRKWKCDFSDPRHREFEVKTWSKSSTPARINEQFIPILYNQALDKAAMRDSLSDHLRQHIRDELALDNFALSSPQACRAWLDSDMKWGGREQPGYVPFLGGLPEGHANTAAFLLDSGFDHRKLAYLNGKIRSLGEEKVDAMQTKQNFRIPQSVNMLLLADFSGTLEEGEVYVSFSSEFQVDDYKAQFLDDIDVLVSRTPAHFASDIQKVRAVYPKALRRLRDVVVFSTKGTCPLAEMLSGGDYDGDRVWVCWDRKIVDNFENDTKPQTMNLYAEGYLKKSSLRFSSLFEGKDMDSRKCADFMYEAFSFNMQKSLLGTCTKYKEKLLYHLLCPIQDPRIAKMAALLSELVDQPKQGVIFDDNAWEKFRHQVLQVFQSLSEPAYSNKDDGGPTTFRKPGSFHILDYLRFEVANSTIAEARESFHKSLKGDEIHHYDPALTSLAHSFEQRAKGSEPLKRILKQLEEDIRKVNKSWTDRVQENKRVKHKMEAIRFAVDKDFAETVNEVHQQWVDIECPPELMAQCPDSQWAFSLLGNGHNTNLWAMLKASKTFQMYYRHISKSTFIWHIAGRQLALMKGLRHESSDLRESAPVLVVPEIWGMLRPRKKVKDWFAQRRDDDSVAALDEVAQYDDDGNLQDDT